MTSSDSSQTIPFKSKKTLHFKPDPQDLNPLTSKTPEKQPSQLPRRARNSGVAFSIKEIRKAAQTRPQQHRTNQIQSARKQILPSPTHQSPSKPTHASTKLPEKYRQLCEFFDSLDSAIRLLKLKRSMSTFTNISPKIECLTDRRFSHSHLAQLKFLLPEAIEIKKVLMFDEKTSCMKPDLHVSIDVDAIECDSKLKSDSKNINLRKVFRARLMDFLKDHPEGDEIPEESLPEPFNLSKPNLHSYMNKNPTSSTFAKSSTDGSIEQQQVLSDVLNVTKVPSMSLAVDTSAYSIKNQQPAAASHLSQSFRRHFSQKLTRDKAVKTEVEQKLSKVSIEPSVVQDLEPCLDQISSGEEASFAVSASPIKLSAKSTSSGKCLPLNCPPAIPIKEIDPVENDDGSPIKIDNMQTTPAKLASTPARLMASTPASHPPKRCYMTPENVSTSSSDKLIRRAPRSRSLKFDTPVKNEKVDAEFNKMESRSVDDDILDILPESLLQSIKEKEKKGVEERDPAISQAKRRRHMIASLPKLFNMVHFFFESIKRSVVTKEELIHKMISNQFDITDRREVEEQITLLLELVPEWISEKLSSGGDLLVRINKLSSPESIRAQLEEAK
ncbi:hypothetical protein LWI28_023125 [Acer negundo]|uniref:CDT1 Geminin-binding domain-containing protein n=1 Tax=Acer negundo TaxID=4023 RepID=A0AAD5J176_ACENE|nr:hypothetical protein LWI28_023125 [Acer negundo]KAK4847923.1 hypothetical protein QYF36_007199 [Acer negundo]